MTSICVAIMDEDNWTSRTDVLVVVDARRRRLTWVPRDLWSNLTGDRINHAFAAGQLLPVLTALGFPCDGVLCLRRGATVAALATLQVEVPVTEPLDFWYPLSPMTPIEEGRKQVSFRPPSERLSGERLHQWIGARYAVHGSGSDLNRLRRQLTLLRALIDRHADFTAVLSDPELWRSEGADPLPTLAKVDNSWRMTVFDRVRPVTIDGKQVLVAISRTRHLVRKARSALRRVLRTGRSG